MNKSISESTLTVQGLTPYAQIPRWILRAGDNLSHGAVRLYGVIMTYADNDTRTAFPGREKLAEDMGIKPRTITTYVKELEAYGALIVDRRRNKRTGNYYANHYTLVFDHPSANNSTRHHFDRRIREIAAPAIAHTIYPETPKTKTMRHNLNLCGIYRLPGDKPLIHNGRKPR